MPSSPYPVGSGSAAIRRSALDGGKLLGNSIRVTKHKDLYVRSRVRHGWCNAFTLIDYDTQQREVAAVTREVQTAGAHRDVFAGSRERLGMARAHGYPQPNHCVYRRPVRCAVPLVSLSEFLR